MIKNIIFDMGNVLISFNPDRFIARYQLEVEEAAILNSVIFKSDEWLKMDAGVMDEAEACGIFAQRLPQNLHETMNQLVMSWDQPLILVEGMEDLIRDLHQRGLKLFLLSNASKRQPEYWQRYPAAKYFEGTLISADYQLLKPQAEIYQTLFEKYDILAEESFFIDDIAENIKGAEAVGMAGYVFDGNVTTLREKLLTLN